MRRSTPRTTASRVGMSMTRATLEKTDDDKKWQEGSFKLLHDEEATEIEHVHPYGFTARPLPPSDENGKKRKAEAVVVYPNGGNRSHGLAIVTGDRRHRPQGMKEGEVQVHDDQGQKMHLTRDGIVISAPKKITLQVGNNTFVIDENGLHLNGKTITHTKAS